MIRGFSERRRRPLQFRVKGWKSMGAKLGNRS
jgi:hypothetical protein